MTYLPGAALVDLAESRPNGVIDIGVYSLTSSSTTTSISSGGLSPTRLDYDNALTSSAYVTTGSSWKYTVPANGLFCFHAGARFLSASGWGAGEYAWLALYRDDINTPLRTSQYTMEASPSTYTFSVKVFGKPYVTAGLELSIRMYQQSGAAKTLPGGSLETTFSFCLLPV